jgi:hypothetical protein
MEYSFKNVPLYKKLKTKPGFKLHPAYNNFKRVRSKILRFLKKNKINFTETCEIVFNENKGYFHSGVISNYKIEVRK